MVWKRWKFVVCLFCLAPPACALYGCATHLSAEKLAAFQKVGTAQVVVVQYQYDDANTIYKLVETEGLPFFEITAQELLRRAKRSPLSADVQNCDAVLRIEVKLVPELRAVPKYIPIDFATQSYLKITALTYGARVSGEISLETSNGISYKKGFDGHRAPPTVITAELMHTIRTQTTQKTSQDMRTQAFYEASFEVRNCFWLAISEFMVEVFGMKPITPGSYKEFCPEPTSSP